VYFEEIIGFTSGDEVVGRCTTVEMSSIHKFLGDVFIGYAGCAGCSSFTRVPRIIDLGLDT
jgi:hypothetical protein